MEEKKPLLDLSTDKYVANIKIDEALYGLLEVRKLSIIQRQKITRLGQSLTGIDNIKTVKDEDRYDKVLLDILCLVMPEATRNLIRRLGIMQKLDAVNAYMEASGLLKKKVTPLRAGTRAKKKRTGAK